jgi:hypothetical protein
MKELPGEFLLHMTVHINLFSMIFQKYIHLPSIFTCIICDCIFFCFHMFLDITFLLCVSILHKFKLVSFNVNHQNNFTSLYLYRMCT